MNITETDIMDNRRKRMLFIYNPKAGTAKIKSCLHEVIDIFVNAGYMVTAYATQSRGEAKQVACIREKAMYDVIVCCGGDGTLDEVVAGMMKSGEQLPIGYIPAGSTNDFAKSLGLSKNILQAAKDITQGNTQWCDVGRFNEDIFVYIAAFGLFTDVSYTTDQHLKNTLGHAAYILEGVKSLSSIKSYRITVENDGIRFEDEYIYGMITNSVSVGGFKNITGKDVELNDGKFEVMLIKKPSTFSELNGIISAITTQKFDSPCVQSFKTSYISITGEEEINWTLDGEFGGSHREVTISNQQNAMRIISVLKH